MYVIKVTPALFCDHAPAASKLLLLRGSDLLPAIQTTVPLTVQSAEQEQTR